MHERWLTEDDDAALESELTREVADAVNRVEALPPVPRESLFDDVYADLPWHLREQRDELLARPPAPDVH
jgi:pyruvate dehydrogenase E1 component alpha subunit/2-oxoisovalerate dehydrogenase E1 component alpha subunit